MNSFFLKKNQSSIISVFVLILLIILMVVSARIYLSDRDELSTLERDVLDLKKKVDIITKNKSLVKEQVNDYNAILTQLIPEREDFFSILYALDQLSEKTGFRISGYTINVTNSTKDKYSLSVQGDGDAQTFLKFLRDYHFAGGRLITNEKIEFTSDEVGKIKLALNFYNKAINTVNAQVKSITPDDLKLMDLVKSKIAVSFHVPTASDSASYATKNNPF